MNINKLLQLAFCLLLLTNTVALLLAVIITFHLPAAAVWVILAITAAIVCAMSIERHNNQKEDQK